MGYSDFTVFLISAHTEYMNMPSRQTRMHMHTCEWTCKNHIASMCSIQQLIAYCTHTHTDKHSLIMIVHTFFCLSTYACLIYSIEQLMRPLIMMIEPPLDHTLHICIGIIAT